jgi:hypothetical protein
MSPRISGYAICGLTKKICGLRSAIPGAARVGEGVVTKVLSCYATALRMAQEFADLRFADSIEVYLELPGWEKEL